MKSKAFPPILIAIIALSAIGFIVWLMYGPSTKGIPKQESGNSSLEDYYNTAKDLKKVKDQLTEVSFLAVGDIMLSRDVATKMSANGKDGFFPFRNIEPLLESTNFNFGNLESPFSGIDAQDPDPNTFTFNAPTWAMKGLSQYNFKVLNLANNHALNQGKDGLLFTRNYLTENYLTSVGAGNTTEEAWAGTVHNAEGIKIGFTGATYAPSSPNLAQITDLVNLKKSVEKLKAESDFVVVTMHAGEEYTREPNTSQTKFAKAAIDYGADMVIGAHPHWVQTMEQYKGKYIFYSLGNFVFDQNWSQETSEGLTLKISLTKKGACIPQRGGSACTSDIQGNPTTATLKQIELIPVIIENNSQPRVANLTEKQNILKKIGVTTSVITPSY